MHSFPSLAIFSTVLPREQAIQVEHKSSQVDLFKILISEPFSLIQKDFKDFSLRSSKTHLELIQRFRKKIRNTWFGGKKVKREKEEEE